MLRMPSDAAPRMSPCSASRLRSRQVIWKIGSMPLLTRKCAVARLERWTFAPAPSVTFTAVASPLSGMARRRNSAGSVDTGGVISAVSTNWPLRSRACSSPAARRSWLMKITAWGRRSYHRRMPELPDVTVYIESLEARIVGKRLERVRLLSPFLLRSAVPPLSSAEGKRVARVQRVGKRIVLAMDDGLYLVLHLMIAGRLRWLEADAKPPGRITLALFEFENGRLAFT